MDDYLCITILAGSGESEADFRGRLSAFWTMMLREHEADFEKVYAEMSAFERHEQRLGRKYLVEADVAHRVTEQLLRAGLDHLPLDPDDVYSKYEAVPPEWFWIEH